MKKLLAIFLLVLCVCGFSFAEIVAVKSIASHRLVGVGADTIFLMGSPGAKFIYIYTKQDTVNFDTVSQVSLRWQYSPDYSNWYNGAELKDTLDMLRKIGEADTTTTYPLYNCDSIKGTIGSFPNLRIIYTGLAAGQATKLTVRYSIFK
jgi:hypothetical protein